MKIYLAGPMRGIPYFNFPAFDEAAEALRAQGHFVFNPAEKDREMHGPDVNNSPTGELTDITGSGFSLREALAIDLAWICAEADAIALLPGWQSSKGAAAEFVTGVAIGAEIIELL